MFVTVCNFVCINMVCIVYIGIQQYVLLFHVGICLQMISMYGLYGTHCIFFIVHIACIVCISKNSVCLSVLMCNFKYCMYKYRRIFSMDCNWTLCFYCKCFVSLCVLACIAPLTDIDTYCMFCMRQEE